MIQFILEIGYYMLILQFNQLGEYCEIKVFTHTLASVRKCGLDKTQFLFTPWGGGGGFLTMFTFYMDLKN